MYRLCGRRHCRERELHEELFACFLVSQALDSAWLLWAALGVFPCPLLWASPGLVAHLRQHPPQLALAAVKHNKSLTHQPALDGLFDEWHSATFHYEPPGMFQVAIVKSALLPAAATHALGVICLPVVVAACWGR